MDLAIMTRCPAHPQRPDLACTRCQDAISVNRMNRGWGRRYVRRPDDGSLAEWVTYQPVRSWFGRDAFRLMPYG